MARKTTYSSMMGHWRLLLDAVAARAGTEPGEDRLRQKLEALLVECAEVQQQQAMHNAARQLLTQKIKVLIPDAQRVATLLRATLRERYGPRSGELVAFGVQPFRGRRRRKAPPESEGAAEAAAPLLPSPPATPEPVRSDG